jgi:hypothetical protein
MVGFVVRPHELSSASLAGASCSGLTASAISLLHGLPPLGASYGDSLADVVASFAHNLQHCLDSIRLAAAAFPDLGISSVSDYLDTDEGVAQLFRASDD